MDRTSDTDANRNLTPFEIDEISLAEGIDPAHEVAEEFRIDPSRVRAIWDGME